MKATFSAFDAAHELYRRGLFLQARQQLLDANAFPSWSDPDALMLALRVSAQLGASRQAWAWNRRALRRFPDHPLVRYYFVRTMLYRRGPWEAWQWWRRLNSFDEADDALRADWVALRGILAALFRDFDEAEACLDRALQLTPDRAWIWCERAYLFDREDRHDEALRTYQHALTLRPWYAPAVQGAAHALELTNRDHEAIQLLTEAAERLESGHVVYQLAGLQMELGQYQAASDLLAKLDRLFPLGEKDIRQAIAAMRSDAAYHQGDEAAAIEFARQAGEGFHASLAENLTAAAPDAKRVLLSVGFVRQHHFTCAPATLTALGRYWNKPLEHLEIAERICYDGTPAHGERAWAEQNGFVAREFTVEWATAAALLDRGVPFTFTTVDVANSHLQGIIGYDARRGTLLVREPSSRRLTEILALKGLEHYRSTGPRGMTLLPSEESARLEGIALPDAELFDDLHALDWALDRHDRGAAHEAYERMRDRAADHRLTWQARRTLAAYDADWVSGQHAQEQLVRLFPGDGVMLYGQWQYLRTVGTRQQRLDFLAPLCDRKDIDPLFRLHYAEELCEDARDFPEAKRQLRRLVRQRWHEARVHRCLGSLAWSERRFSEAMRHYRLAACLADKDERHAWTWFTAARQMKTTQEVLDWLESRCQRYGHQSSEPAKTLCSAYATLDRMSDAFRVLESALQRRPEDGGLLLYAADTWARSGDFARAEHYLRAAEGASHRAAWLHAAAEIASFQGELARSLEYWQQLLTVQPQSPDAASSIARLLSQLEGDEAARQFLRELLARFPHNVELLQRTVEWFRDEPEEFLSLVRRLIEANPVDGWARRELALVLADRRQFDEALAEAELAVVLDPLLTTTHSVLGSVLESAGQFDRAQAEYRRAIELSVDNQFAIYGLMRLSPTHAERCQALQFVYNQLVEQTMYGEGLLAYVECARGALPGEQVLANLRRAHEARPDLWHCWSALVRELIDLGRLDEAEAVAREVADRFPLLPGAWGDLAQVCLRRKDEAGEIAALEHALAINPVWGRPLQQLADAYQRAGDLDRCREFVQSALRRTPNDAVLHGFLADVLWALGQREAALDEAERGVRLDIDYGWAWGRLVTWGGEAGQPQRAEVVARDLVDKRPHMARAWYWFGRVVYETDVLQRRAAFCRAIELNPLARSWRDEQNYAEALQACRAVPWGERRPAALRIEEARTMAAAGDIAEAIALAEAISQNHRDDYEAWSLLSSLCYDHAQEKEKCLRAAEMMVALASIGRCPPLERGS
jgi:tetratricopeptide (TPR) repeat protein